MKTFLALAAVSGLLLMALTGCVSRTPEPLYSPVPPHGPGYAPAYPPYPPDPLPQDLMKFNPRRGLPILMTQGDSATCQ